MTSYQNTIMDLLKGETPKAKHDYLVALLLDRDKFAIEFAKWMSIEGFTYSDSFGYCLSENPKYCDNDGFPIEHSLEQLLQLFHSQKQTQG